jgi:hypothetical protein
MLTVPLEKCILQLQQLYIDDFDFEQQKVLSRVTRPKIVMRCVLEDTGLGVKRGAILSLPLKTLDLKKSHIVVPN